MLIRNAVFLFVAIFSFTLLALENDSEILNKANQFYDKELYLESAAEFKKLISSKSIFFKAQGYLGVADSNFWLDGKEKESLEFYNKLLNDKKLLIELSISFKVSLYRKAGWLNSFIENYPQAFLLYNQSIKTYEKNLLNKDKDNEYAKNSYCNALYDLAYAYDFGIGTEQNYKKTYETYMKSSNYCKETESMNNIGVMYEQGLYVEQDFANANKWYLKAMDVNNKEPSLMAKANHAYLMANGFGTDKNISLALEYINEVIDSKIAQIEIIELAKEYRDIISSEDENMIKAIDYIDNFVCNNVETDAKKGKDVSRNFQTCLGNANKNNSSAQYQIGYFFQNGIGVKKNIDIAINWYLKASNEIELAKFRLAKLIQEGRTDLYDMNKSIDLFLELKNTPLNKDNSKNFVNSASFELGIIYMHGVGVDRDLEKAKKHFEEILTNKNPYNIKAEKQLDNIKSIKAGFATENNIVNYFPAEFKGSFIWENESEADNIIITKLTIDKIKQVGVTHYNILGSYEDDEKNIVQINGFIDSRYNNIELWESNPMKIVEGNKIPNNDFELDGSYFGFFEEEFSNINAHWVPSFVYGPRGVLKLERTNKIKKTIQDFDLIENVNFGKYYALVIGNNNYMYMNPPLEMAIADANAVSEVLKNKYKFEIIDTITDGNYKKIMTSLNNLKNIIKPYDNLLIYYAGHGYQDSDVGYWIPIDGADPSDEDESQWISSQKISRTISKIPAKHILIVADSCYSGTLIERGAKKNKLKNDMDYFNNLLSKKTRRALTSGANEPVVDGGGEGHSVFASAFLRILSNQRNVLTTSELYYELVKEVAQKVSQTPQYGTISKAGDEGGDFIFVPRN